MFLVTIYASEWRGGGAYHLSRLSLYVRAASIAITVNINDTY